MGVAASESYGLLLRMVSFGRGVIADNLSAAFLESVAELHVVSQCSAFLRPNSAFAYLAPCQRIRAILVWPLGSLYEK